MGACRTPPGGVQGYPEEVTFELGLEEQTIYYATNERDMRYSNDPNESLNLAKARTKTAKCAHTHTSVQWK